MRENGGVNQSITGTIKQLITVWLTSWWCLPTVQQFSPEGVVMWHASPSYNTWIRRSKRSDWRWRLLMGSRTRWTSHRSQSTWLDLWPSFLVAIAAKKKKKKKISKYIIVLQQKPRPPPEIVPRHWVPPLYYRPLCSSGWWILMDFLPCHVTTGQKNIPECTTAGQILIDGSSPSTGDHVQDDNVPKLLWGKF